MKLRITLDSKDHYKVYRRYLLLIWIEEYIYDKPWFNSLKDAEDYCTRLCKQEKLPKVVKEINCKD